MVLAVIVLAAPLVRLGPSTFSEHLLQEIQSNQLYRLNSAVHRWLIWQFVAEKITERPVLGWGLDSSRAIPGAHESVQGYTDRLPLHPHNAALQVWLELGFLGSLIGAFLAAWPVLRIDRTIAGGNAQAAAVGVVAAIAVVALLGFGIWQSWWIAAISLVAALTVAVLPPRDIVG